MDHTTELNCVAIVLSQTCSPFASKYIFLQNIAAKLQSQICETPVVADLLSKLWSPPRPSSVQLSSPRSCNYLQILALVPPVREILDTPLPWCSCWVFMSMILNQCISTLSFLIPFTDHHIINTDIF